MNTNALCFTGVALAALVATAGSAATISYPPPGGVFASSSQEIAANVSQYGNVWSGVAESFTAEDSNVAAGFYLYDQSGGADKVLYSLYAGDGQFSTLLAQKTVTLSLAPYSDALELANFSSVSLVPGESYTLEASQPGQALPDSGNYSDVSILYASVAASVYAGGRFYFVGSSYSEGSFASRDIAFEVTPTAVPEPATWALMLGGVGCLGGALRTSRRPPSVTVSQRSA